MRSALLAVLLLSPAVAAPTPETAADLLLTGGKVWTADASRPWAEAVAVREGRIVFVGRDAEAMRLRGPKTNVVALRGRLVTPGFEDAHLHLMSGARNLERVDLSEETTLAGLQETIRRFAEANPKSPWVVGRGWVYGSFPGGLPIREQLDAIVPDRPAYMDCYDGHTGWANSKALALAGITKETKDPVNGTIVRDPKTGEPTGALKEAAGSLVEELIPEPSAQRHYALLLQALALLNRTGITAVQDAGWTPEEVARFLPLLERARAEGKLTVRTRMTVDISPDDPAPGIAEAVRLRDRYRDGAIVFGGVKGYVDGVIEAHTAAMLAPYSDEPALGTGTPRWEKAALDRAVAAADKAGLQVWLHAIGDRGIRMALDAYEAAAKQNGARDRRDRVEHVEAIDAADAPRFGALGAVASMQPLHANPDQNNEAVWSRNIGPERAGRGFAWRLIEQGGGRLAFGSDWPVVTPDVFRGLYCAVARKTREGKPAGGWQPRLAVSVESALRHYTIDAAWAGFGERERGSITVGKSADLVVLSRDILAAPPEEILKTRVLMTLLDGKPVWRDPSFE
jgi:predicted amidohydrolase YtcJ